MNRPRLCQYLIYFAILGGINKLGPWLLLSALKMSYSIVLYGSAKHKLTTVDPVTFTTIRQWLLWASVVGD